MQKLSGFGKYLFLSAIAGIGAVHLVTGNFPSGLIPLPDHFAAKNIFVWISGLLLISACLGCLVAAERRASLICLMALLFFFFIYPNLIKSLGDLHNPSQWTATCEMLSLLTGVCIFRSFFIEDALQMGARVALTVALLVFGLLHILYYDYIQTLVPAWIPFPRFWGYVVVLMFFATALSVVLNVKVIEGLFGLMFLLWVFLLHIPRVFATPRMEPEWTSLFVAMAMSGIGFMLAGQIKKQPPISLKVLSFYRSIKTGRD
jgi:uncharacterized membrane protein